MSRTVIGEERSISPCLIGQIEQLEWAQDLDYNYHLFFCECDNFKEARLEQCPIIALGFDIGPLAQYLTRCILEIMLAGYPLLKLLCSR